jgi:hypothetical protein
MRRGQGVFSIVALDGVQEELKAAITELRPKTGNADSVAESEAAHPSRARATRGG